MNFLDKINNSRQEMNDKIKAKLENNQQLTEDEILAYQLNADDVEISNIFNRVITGEKVPGFNLTDFLATPQAKVLIPKVIIGAARKAADPIYLASKFYKKVKIKSGQVVQFPSFGVIRAYDVAEGAEIPAESVDWQLHSSSLINVGKAGVRVQYTDEIIKETEFDIVSMLTSEAGRAMARHKEQKAFNEFMKHGYTVFDNELYNKDKVAYAEAATTGVDYDNNLNGTMSLEDFLDLCIAVDNNGYVPTDVVMHNLAFPAFVKNGLTGALTAMNDIHAKVDDATKKFTLGPEAIAGKLPFGLTVNLSPFAPVNRKNKTFDIIVLDRNNVGTMIVKDELKTEDFRDPARDLNNVKFVERYGFGTKDEGRAVCYAKNISMSKSYPAPFRVLNISKDN